MGSSNLLGKILSFTMPELLFSDSVEADFSVDQLGGKRPVKLRNAAFEADTADVPATPV